MANQFKDSLVEAMQIMFDEDSKMTYDCTVIKCLDAVTGEYELDYMSNKTKAYCLDTSKKYKANDLVMVIAPKGDFNDIKYILGLVNPEVAEGGGGETPDPEKEENTYLRLTDDLLDKDNPDVDIFGLKSYYSTNYSESLSYYEEDITTKVCEIPRFKERIIKYINGKELTYLRLGITIKTSLSQEQIYSSGSYGIKLYIPYIDKGYIEYDFNSNAMEGSPKSFLSWTPQILDIRVDQGLVYNEALSPIVKIYKKDFILDETKVKEPDIQIKSVDLYVMSMLTPEEMKGYRVFISATGGNYFIKSDSITASKTLTATLKANGIDTDISKDEMYWLIEDSTIDETDAEYFNIAGAGWRCLNPYTIEESRNELGEPVKKVIFESRLESIEVVAKTIAGSRRFKCLIKHNGNFFSGETIITNETATFYLGLSAKNGNTVSVYEDEVEIQLKFHYKGLTENLDNAEKICYTWSKIEKDNTEDFYFTKKYLRIIEKNKVVVEEDGRSFWVTTATFPASIITEAALIKCNVTTEGPIETIEEFKQDKNHFIGTAELKLTMASEYVDPYLDDMRKALPKVLYSYNTTEFKIQQQGFVIASIACKLLRKTDLEGHLVVNLIASEYSNAVVRFLDNEMTELFAPVTFTLYPGRNTVEVPHAYLYRLAGIHSFIVTMQCTNGTVTVPVRGVLFTIEGGYLIEKLLDVGMDVQDLTIKQSKGIEFDEEWIPYEPEEIWAIGVTDGAILVKSCPYQTDNSTVEWTPKYDMGKGLTAAIEFDGQWILREEEQIYTILTEKEPFVFIVELDGTLVVYNGGDLTTRKILDTNVTKISVVRGYKSEEYKNQDQGMICAYIKNKTPHYIQYTYEETSNKYLWREPVMITSEEVLDIYVQRLNDYRVGFLLEFKDRNEWLISQRVYVNQAVPKENISFFFGVDKIGSTLAMVPADKPLLKGAVVFEDEYAPQSTFYVDFNYPVVIRDKEVEKNLKKYITVKINKTVTQDYNIKIEGKRFNIIFDPPVSASRHNDTTLEWSFSAPVPVQLDIGEGHFDRMRDFNYSWTFKRKMNTIEISPYNDRLNFPITAECNFSLIEIQNIKVPIKEQLFEKGINLITTLVLTEVNPVDQSYKEKLFDKPISLICDIKLTLVGESPI